MPRIRMDAPDTERQQAYLAALTPDRHPALLLSPEVESDV